MNLELRSSEVKVRDAEQPGEVLTVVMENKVSLKTFL